MMKPNRLAYERNAYPLDVTTLTKFIYGGAEQYKLYREALEYILKNTAFLDDDYGFYDLSRSEKRELTFRNFNILRELGRDITSRELLQKTYGIINESKKGVLSRHGMSLYFFGGAIMAQGTQEQVDDYIPRLERLEITGCYCITELATGSYVKAFQTTATFIEETDEFEINTPTLTATKWWVGNAASTATHGVVIARLIIKGEDLGPHNFVVRLRDENFDLCKGVAIGDVGPKRGCDGTDNGWLQFDHVRIPREQMLMKWSKVARDGSFTRKESPQISYGGLIGPRVGIVSNVVHLAKRAVTIASRYSIVRDQYSMEGKALLDYLTQQERIIGALCSTYAFDFATLRLQSQYEAVTKELQQKDTSHLKELHNTVAAFKGFVTLWGSRALNDCILALGGHSYSQLSELPRLLADSAPTIPYDGDAIVLVQQTASYLVKSAGAVMSGSDIEGESVQYLKNLKTLDSMAATADATRPLSLDDMRKAAMWLALTLVKEAGEALMNEVQKRGDKEAAWNARQLQLVQAAKAHFMYGVIDAFQDTLDNQLAKSVGAEDQLLLQKLTQLAELFALRHLEEFLRVFYEHGYFSTSRGGVLSEQILALYEAIRPYVCRLVDAWDIHDQVLGTPLARYDGDIYEHYFKAVNSLPQETRPSYWSDIINSGSDLQRARRSPEPRC